MRKLDFTSKEPQPFSDMGGDHVALRAGNCALCGRSVYGEADAIGDRLGRAWHEHGPMYEPDPRGTIPPRHALSSMTASEFDMSGPDVPFCWDCVNEHGSERYQECLAIARAKWTAVLV